MGNSLFDQLNKTGLVDKNKAKQVKKDKHRQAKQQKGRKDRAVSESKQRAQQLQVEKARHDRELNQQRKLQAEKKAIAAQIRQLIEMNRVTGGDSEADAEIAFNFVDGKNVQRMYVTDTQQTLLTRGRLAIVKLGSSYNLVPVAVADKISQRDPSCVIYSAAAAGVSTGVSANDAESSEADDPYADFQVPDDLMW